MKLKRFVAIVISLAMVLSIVPAFSLTVSAAPKYSVTDLIDMSDYSFVGDNLGGSWRGWPWADVPSTSNWYGWGGACQLYSISDTQTIIDAHHSDGVIYANDAVHTGTQGKDFFVFTWVAEGDGDAVEDMKILTGDGSTAIDTFRFRASNAEGLNYTWANTGWEAKFSGVATDYTYEDNASASDGSATGMTQYYIVYANDEDGDGYTASYYYGTTPTWIGTKTFATGTVNGFYGYEMKKVMGTWSRMYNVEIYAGNYPTASNEATIAAALGEIGVPSMTKGNLELPTSVVDDYSTEAIVTWSSNNEAVISNTGVVTSPSQVTTVTLTPTATAEIDGETLTATGNARTVTVFPGSLAGTKNYDVDGTYYNVSETNLIGANWDFSEGLTAWQDGTGATINSQGFQILQEGDVYYADVVNYSSSNSGGGSAQALKRTITGLESGKTYLLALTAKNIPGEWTRVSINGSEIQPFSTVGDAWTRQTYVFTSTTDSLAFAFRWCDSQYESFELYELTKAEAPTVTINYLNSNGDVVKTVSKDALIGGSVTFDAVEYIENGILYTAEAITIENVLEDITRNVDLVADTTKRFTTNNFSYDFKDAAVAWAGDNGFSGTNGTIAIGWGDFRATVMKFPAPKVEGEVVSKATLNVNIGYKSLAGSGRTEDPVEYDVYVFDPAFIGEGTMQNVTAGVTWANRTTTLNEIGAVQVADATVGSFGWNTIELDLSKAVNLTSENIALLITSANQVYTYSATTDNKPYLSDIETDVSAATTIKFVDSSNTTTEIADAVTVKGFVGDVIDLTDTNIVPDAITYNGSTYTKDEDNATSYAVEGVSGVVTITYTTDDVTSVKSPAEVTIIEGNDPILPMTLTGVTGKGAEVPVTVEKWTVGEVVDGVATATATIEGLNVTATASVTVLPETFNMSDIEAGMEKDATADIVHSFPVALTGDVTFEFDVVFKQLVNGTITIGDSNLSDRPTFGAAGDAISIQSSSAGARFRSFKKNGNSMQTIGDVTYPIVAGDTYRFLITSNPDDETWSAVITDKNGVATLVAENFGYRSGTDVTQFDSITVYDNNNVADTITLSNIKVNAPSATIETYTVNAVAGSETLETFNVYTSSTTDFGYGTDKIFPNVRIPDHTDKGYVFKSKSVDTNAKTVTLTYEEADQSENANFFSNAPDDATLVSLNMLGAHDAFTSGMTNKGDAANAKLENDALFGAAVNAYRSTAVDVSKAQSADVLTLLNSGVRYFDIRLSRSTSDYSDASIPHTNGVFYTTHGLLADEFRPIAYTISQWAALHPGEVVILDFQAVADDGAASEQTWKDIWSILDEAGIDEYTSINTNNAGNSNLANKTLAEFTDNRAKAGILTFGQYTGRNVGNFILRRNGDVYSGRLFSAYSTDDGLSTGISNSFSEAYIDAQVELAKAYKNDDNSIITWLVRVMQAQTSSSVIGGNLIEEAADDHTAFLEAVANNPEWLTALPIVMVDDAVNATDIVALLKSNNEKKTVKINYVDESGNIVNTVEKQLMVGTLYEEEVAGTFADDANTYYVEKSTVRIPNNGEVVLVPSTGDINIKVVKLGNVYTLQNGLVYTGKMTDNRSDIGANNFAAYTWGQDHNRIGIAILSAEANASAYALSAKEARSSFNQDYGKISFYAVSAAAYNAIDISNKEALLSLLTSDNLVYTETWGTEGERGQDLDTMVEYPLDAEKISNIAAQGDVVIIGDAEGGLYGLYGDGMAILTGYTVTVDGNAAFYEPNEVFTHTLTGDAVVLVDADKNIYAPVDGVVTITVTSDLSLASTGFGLDMVTGAQVRIGDGVDANGKVDANSGLRFITKVEKTGTLAAIEGAKFGVEITAEGSTHVEVIPTVDWQVEGEVFTTALTNLAVNNYNRKFTATPYVEIGGTKYFGTPVTRSIYQVAAGLLTTTDVDGTEYDNTALESQVLYDVLNAYVNQVGIRLSFSEDALAEYTGTNGAYTGNAFFTVSDAKVENQVYTIVITPVGEKTEIKDYATEYVRLNNNNNAVADYITVEANVDEGGNATGTYTLTFDYAEYLANK